MADRTTETQNGASEAAAEAAGSHGKSGGLNPWVPLIITVLIMPALAFATTRFVLVPQMKKAMAPASAASEESSSSSSGTNSEAGAGLIDGKVKQSVPMSKILVNVAGTMGTRYLMTSVTLVGTESNLKDIIKDHNDQLLDLATSTLCTKTISDLEKPGARNVIRAELMTVFNNALGGPLIKEIYITELAIQ